MNCDCEPNPLNPSWPRPAAAARSNRRKLAAKREAARSLAGGRATIEKFHPRLSIATEHSPEDGVKIPEAVHQIWTGYQMMCGPCLETKDGHVRPDVLYFR